MKTAKIPKVAPVKVKDAKAKPDAKAKTKAKLARTKPDEKAKLGKAKLAKAKSAAKAKPPKAKLAKANLATKTKAKPTKAKPAKAKPGMTAKSAPRAMKGKSAKKRKSNPDVGGAIFVLTRIPGGAYLQLKLVGSHDWIHGAKAGSLKKGVVLVDAIKARCTAREHYDLTQVKAAHNPHWYFTLRDADGTKLGGLGGFATKADAEAGIALVGRVAQGAELAM